MPLRPLNARRAAVAVTLALAAASAVVPSTAAAASVTLTGWAFGSGGKVDGNLYQGQAGGFKGSLSGAGVFDTPSFITYCVELEESFSFSSAAMTGHELVPGATYFGKQAAESLGRLLGYVMADPRRVDSADESTSLQLAIWNLVYDGDASMARGGRFSDRSSFAPYAESLLRGSAGFDASGLDVFALRRAGTQDFLLVAPRPVPSTSQQVPLAPTWALLAAALLALQAAQRRLRTRRSR
jgi:hypothetical protein